MSVVVFGGNGFVGTSILRVLRTRKIPCISVSRSGVKPAHLKNEAWAEEVVWAKGDALVRDSFSSLMKDASAVVIAVGTPPVPFVDENWQVMMNGGIFFL